VTATTQDRRRYLDQLRLQSRRRGWPARSVLAAVACSIGERGGSDVTAMSRLPLLANTDPVTLGDLTPPPKLCRPSLLGDVHEVLLGYQHRRRRGVFYTPGEVAQRLVEAATSTWEPPTAPRVGDPASGGGAFLLAAGVWLESLGLDRRTIVDELLWGVDIDPTAAMVTEAALALWAAEHGSDARPHVAVADSLRSGLDAWDPPARPFDLVIGNPPFQNQLERRTARDRDTASALRERFGGVVVGYVDTASLFLVAACRLTRPGGRVALVVPQSFLAARDAEPARAALLEQAALTGLWLPRAALFEASVRVCVPVLERAGEPRSVTRWSGETMDPAPPWGGGSPPMSQSWAPLAADLIGAPSVATSTASTLGEWATATAGFRDQFYGLIPFVEEAEATSRRPRLVTSGLIEPGALAGGKAVRFAGRRFENPGVDIERLEASDGRLAAWGRARLVPKVVVATQSRVLEAAVDEEGCWWPSVPVIAVHADPDQLWLVAAAINSPFASAWACQRATGAALSDGAIKLSAAQVLELPLPLDRGAWESGADLLTAVARERSPDRQRRALLEFGATMSAAYELDHTVLEWWRARLPRIAPVTSLAAPAAD
jgi:hypothetical protein